MFDFDLEPGKDNRNQYEGIRWDQPLMTIITPFFNAGKQLALIDKKCKKHTKKLPLCIAKQNFEC